MKPQSHNSALSVIFLPGIYLKGIMNEAAGMDGQGHRSAIYDKPKLEEVSHGSRLAQVEKLRCVV